MGMWVTSHNSEYVLVHYGVSTPCHVVTIVYRTHTSITKFKSSCVSTPIKFINNRMSKIVQ